MTTVWNILAVNANMPEDLAYNITKTMIEKREDLAPVHKEGLNIKPRTRRPSAIGVPWHPGALKYFKEKGIKHRMIVSAQIALHAAAGRSRPAVCCLRRIAARRCGADR